MRNTVIHDINEKKMTTPRRQAQVEIIVQNIVLRVGKQLKYSPKTRLFYVCDGSTWTEDQTHRAQRFALESIRDYIWNDSSFLWDKACLNLETNRGVKTIIKRLKRQPSILKIPTDLLEQNLLRSTRIILFYSCKPYATPRQVQQLKGSLFRDRSIDLQQTVRYLVARGLLEWVNPDSGTFRLCNKMSESESAVNGHAHAAQPKLVEGKQCSRKQYPKKGF